MGGINSSTKYRQNTFDTPPKANHRLLFDPRSPSDGISRTPIQIDSQVPVQPLKLYNHVMPYIIGPDINISEEDNRENNEQENKLDIQDNEQKRSSGVEPTLDPTKVLTTLVETNNGQLPPYQL